MRCGNLPTRLGFDRLFVQDACFRFVTRQKSSRLQFKTTAIAAQEGPIVRTSGHVAVASFLEVLEVAQADAGIPGDLLQGQVLPFARCPKILPECNLRTLGRLGELVLIRAPVVGSVKSQGSGSLITL